MSPEEMRKHCAMMKEHHKEPMDAKMKAMQDKCQAMMAADAKAATPPPKP